MVACYGAIRMDQPPKVKRDNQVMVRLSDLEYAALSGAATGADRKTADMARVLMLRGLYAGRLNNEDGR